MAKVKAGFSGLSVPNQIERARHIYNMVSTSPYYPSPTPGMAVFNSAINKLERAYNVSRTRDMVRMAEMRLRRKELLELVRQLAAYVQTASGGNIEKIGASGFDFVGPRNSRPPVGQVHNLRLREGKFSGQIRALWNKAIDAVAYEVHLSESPDTESFRHYRTVCKTRFVLTGLKPGSIYYVRIIAVGRKGYGTWSNVAVKVAQL